MQLIFLLLVIGSQWGDLFGYGQPVQTPTPRQIERREPITRGPASNGRRIENLHSDGAPV